MKKYVKANWETYFWDLHDKNFETGTVLEDIIDRMGLSDKFFPEDGEPTANELDYKTIIDTYSSYPPDSEMIYNIMENIVGAIRKVDGITACSYDLDSNSLHIVTDDRKRFQLSIEKLGGL